MDSKFHFHKFDNLNPNFNQTSQSNNNILINDPNRNSNSNNFLNYNMSQSNAFKENNKNISKNDFLKKILEIDFKKEIENNNIDKIQPFLFNMIVTNFDNYGEDVSYLISNFQKILKYLNDIQLGLNEKNNQLEKIIEIKDKKLNLIKENNLKIEQLQNQINKTTQIEMKYKLLLKKNNQKLPGYIDDKKKLYVCDVCKNKKFYNYELFHKHYVKCHIDPNLDNGVNIAFMNNTFNKIYFDNQINELSKELNLMISKSNENENEDNLNENNFLEESNQNQSQNQNQNSTISLKMSRRFTNPRRNYKGKEVFNFELENKLKKFRELQQKKYETFLSQFNMFRDDVYKQLNKYSKQLNNNNKIKNNI